MVHALRGKGHGDTVERIPTMWKMERSGGVINGDNSGVAVMSG